MKRILIFCVMISLYSIHSLNAQNPIPSYNFPVYQHANFQEQSRVQTKGDNCLEKRNVVVNTSCVGSGISVCSATVWVYSLDGQTTFGPFTVYGGETLYVEIDEREWGVYVMSDDHVEVDVWIE
ncbi:MAG: hypothetical protein WCK09_05080 [Bacteroidota bacterium]